MGITLKWPDESSTAGEAETPVMLFQGIPKTTLWDAGNGQNQQGADG